MTGQQKRALFFEMTGQVSAHHTHDYNMSCLGMEAEREECAKVAENRILDKANCTAEQMYELQKKNIASDIRARGQE